MLMLMLMLAVSTWWARAADHDHAAAGKGVGGQHGSAWVSMGQHGAAAGAPPQCNGELLYNGICLPTGSFPPRLHYSRNMTVPPGTPGLLVQVLSRVVVSITLSPGKPELLVLV